MKYVLLLCVLLVAGCSKSVMLEDELREQANVIAQTSVIVDGHIDVPYRLAGVRYEDISQSTVGGDFDYPRAKSGGLNAPFMSIYIPARYQETGGAIAYADSLIDMVEGFARSWPDKFQIATSIADVREQFSKGLISLPLGMENGAPIENDLANLEYFRDRGIRYITLTHSRDNLICDSSYDTTRTWNGLSPFGEQVIDEMNRLGIMVDISHVSDSAFYQVVNRTDVPVIASHSSARHFTPGWERNMNDDMIRRLGANGGVIMINFGSSFLKTEYQEAGRAIQEKIQQEMEENGLDAESDEGFEVYSQQRAANPVGTIEDVVAHINHVVDLIGVDHVGLGSDYDGVFALPKDLQDASQYPNLVYALVEEGYSEEDIKKILGENLLRVWSEVERAASS